MQEENLYLENVVKVIDKQINDFELQKIELDKEIFLIRDQLSENFDDLDNEELSRHKVDLDEAEKTLYLLEKKKESLKRQLKRPYFARIDFLTIDQPCQKIYIGTGNIMDKNILVYDWRAPICSLYYDFETGPASYICEDGEICGDINLKRQFCIEDKNLKYYIDTKETINDEILQQVLSKNSSSKMQEIVSTIQKEQNALIRSDKNENLLVQGIAGSGKTSIALHRVAYLLYKEKNNLKSGDIFILSPSNLFSEYISQVLPQLGEDVSPSTTFSTIAKVELGQNIQSRSEFLDELCYDKTSLRASQIAYKASFEFLEDLNIFLKDFYSKTFRAKDLVFSTKDSETPLFVFKKEEIENLYYNVYKDLDICKRISYTSEYLIERFNLKKKEFKPIKERFSKFLYNFFPSTEPSKILSLFLSTKNINQDEKNLYQYDNVAGLLIIKDYLFGLKTSLPAKYLIIDEMQDFTPAHFYVFNKIWDCPKLVLGDINQCVEKVLSEEYLRRLADFLSAKIITLNKTYRSTKQISTFCQNIISLKGAENMSREGENPQVIKSFDQTKDIYELISQNINKYKHIAIICKTTKELNYFYERLVKILPIKAITEKDSSFDHKILITTAGTAKGIEFDFVIIPNVDRKNYNDALDRNILYVSGTRALHKLAILYSQEKSLLI